VSDEAMSDQPSPLGRYDEPHAADGSGPEQLYEVRLLRVPVRLYAEGRRHHDDLLQELSVLAVSTEESEGQLPPHLAELVDVLGRRYGTPTDRPDAPIDEAVARGESSVDLTYRVPAHMLEAADRLENLLAQADELCRSGELLAMPRSETMLAFSGWYLDEFRRQIAGEAPRPWPEADQPGPDQPGPDQPGPDQPR
jgi:hypothetical protein